MSATLAAPVEAVQRVWVLPRLLGVPRPAMSPDLVRARSRDVCQNATSSGSNLSRALPRTEMSDTVLHMPRIQRSALPAGVFHVTSRGLRRQKIFLDHYDYEHFERDLRRITSDFEWTLATYCLMPNHFHLLIEAQPLRLAAGMQRLKLRHAVRFNQRNNSSGYVFERRDWSVVMEDERDLCEVARYIVLHPLRA